MSNGGPAFPVPEVGTHKNAAECVTHAGMTLRDYFAAAALPALIAKAPTGIVMQSPQKSAAEAAYAYADAMIAASGK